MPWSGVSLSGAVRLGTVSKENVLLRSLVAIVVDGYSGKYCSKVERLSSALSSSSLN